MMGGACSCLRGWGRRLGGGRGCLGRGWYKGGHGEVEREERAGMGDFVGGVGS